MIIPIGKSSDHTTKMEYMCYKTDLTLDYPTISGCNPGSTCICVDTVTHTLYKTYIYDGIYWNVI